MCNSHLTIDHLLAENAKLRDLLSAGMQVHFDCELEPGKNYAFRIHGRLASEQIVNVSELISQRMSEIGCTAIVIADDIEIAEVPK